MRKLAMVALPLGMALFLAGCQSLPPGAEPGPDGTMAYTVLLEASEPGAKIEANGEILGDTPLNLKIFGDPDGTFHDFGSEVYVIRALPLTTNQYVQIRVFGTGRWFGPEDRIPQRIHFDMNQPPPPAPQYVPGAPVYIYPYGPPVYYDFYFGGPYYYGRPYYHGGYYHGGYYRGHHHGGGLQYYRSPSSGGARTR